MASKVSLAIVGLGAMAHVHLKEILKQTDTTDITVVCEPSRPAYQDTMELSQKPT